MAAPNTLGRPRLCEIRLASISRNDLLAGRRPSLQLALAKFATQPGRRQREQNQRNRIPVWSKGRPFIPRDHCANDAHEQSHETQNYGMHHGAVSSQTLCDIAGHRAENGTVGGSDNQRAARQRLAHRREISDGVQDDVVPKLSKIPTAIPANKAAMLRAIRRGGCGSFMISSLCYAMPIRERDRHSWFWPQHLISGNCSAA